MLANASSIDLAAFTIRTVHGDVMTVSNDMLQRWANYRQLAQTQSSGS